MRAGAITRQAIRVLTPGSRMHTIRAAVQTGTPLGNERFKQEIEQTLRRRVGQARRGRPKKIAEKGYVPL